jgi:formate dehydrogenase major subunit
VILPASAFPEKTGTFTNTDRRVQLGRQALPLPGDTRHDLWIIQQLAQRLGLTWQYDSPADVWAEIRQAVPSCAGMDWTRIDNEHGVTYPCRNEGDPGEEVLFTTDFPTADGRARIVPANFMTADELPDSEYPLVLITGRVLEHWHTGSMTRRAGVLDAIEPVPTVSINPSDLAALGAAPGDPVALETRRGRIVAIARRDPATPRGSVFTTFAYAEAAANILTNPKLDPFGKIPEFKYCAVRLTTASEEELAAATYGAASEVTGTRQPHSADGAGRQRPADVAATEWGAAASRRNSHGAGGAGRKWLADRPRAAYLDHTSEVHGRRPVPASAAAATAPAAPATQRSPRPPSPPRPPPAVPAPPRPPRRSVIPRAESVIL